MLISVLFVLVGACWSAPVDEPIRVDLPVFNDPQPSGVLVQNIVPENPGGEHIDQATGGNVLTYKLQAAGNLLGSKLDSKNSIIGAFAPGVPTLESAIQESEGFGSKTLTIKENLQGIVAGLFQPKPIVDTIEEHEKYGNTGDKFYSTGRAIVGGASGVSNFVNTVLEVPGNIFKKLTRTATEKLNNLGGKIIGL